MSASRSSAPRQALARIDYAHGLALLRMGFGGYFLSEGLDKSFRGGWLVSSDQLLNRLAGPQGTVTRGGGEAWYRGFLEQIVVPNVDVFARLVALGELTVGLLLILGLFTRAAALGGMWLNLNYMLMKGVMNNVANSDHLFLLAESVFLIVAAGRVWGLDALWRSKFANIPVIGWLSGAPATAVRMREYGKLRRVT